MAVWKVPEARKEKKRGNTKGKKKKKDKSGGKMQKKAKRNKGKKRGEEKNKIVFTGLSVGPSVGSLPS